MWIRPYLLTQETSKDILFYALFLWGYAERRHCRYTKNSWKPPFPRRVGSLIRSISWGIFSDSRFTNCTYDKSYWKEKVLVGTLKLKVCNKISWIISRLLFSECWIPNLIKADGEQCVNFFKRDDVIFSGMVRRPFTPCLGWPASRKLWRH